MTTFLIIAAVAVYLLVGAGIVFWALYGDTPLLWAVFVSILIIIAWPYFILRSWIDQ